MHVFEVVEIEEQGIAGLPGWSLTRERRRWIARDPSGAVRATGRVRGNVEASAQEYAARSSSARPSDTEQPRDREGSRSSTRRANRNPVADPNQRSAADRGSSERGRNGSQTRTNGRVEPTLTREPGTPRNDSGIETPLRALHPEVPTVDELTPAERRAYERGESFEKEVGPRRGRSGRLRIRVTPDMVDEQTRIKSGAAPSIRADRDDSSPAQSRNRNPSVSKSLLGKAWDWISSNRFVRAASSFFTLKGAITVNAAINTSAVEDQLDAYYRAIFADAAEITDPQERQEFLNGIENNNMDRMTPGVLRAWGETNERITQLFLEAVVNVVMAGGWIAFLILTGFSLGTGFVGGILSLVAGGIVTFGGSAALIAIFEEVGIVDWIEDNLVAQIFTPATMLKAVYFSDGAQELAAIGLDWVGRGLTFGGVQDTGDIIRDSIMHEETGTTVTPNQATEILKNFIKSDPKLIQTYNNGKEEAKEIMRSGDPEEEESN